MYLFFSFSFRYIISCTLVLWPFDIHCTYIWFIYILMYVISPISARVVSFLSLYTCFLFIVCNLLFLFQTKILWWVLFKVFQKYRLSKSSYHKLSSYKFFQEFMTWVIYDFYHMFICLLWFCHEFPKGEIVRTYAFHMIKNICHDFM